MNSLICNWFEDWGRTIKSGLGTNWMIVFLVAFSLVAIFLFCSIISAAIKKPKITIKWGQLIFLVIFILFIIWFSVIL